MTQYQDQTHLLVAVDCIIFGFDNEELKLLLIKRDFEPERDKWSLMGGFLRPQETADEAAKRVLHRLTGLQDVYLDQVHTFSAPGRDPVERTVSIAYYALINIEDHNEELSEQHGAKWFSLKEAPKLIFDHEQMVTAAIQKLRYKTSVQPIGFELLPEKFTMRQLQKLYEAILDEELDKRNFVKKINQLDILTKLDEKDMTSSKKGSYLFQFDQSKYEKQASKGFSLKLANQL
ncbi:NUDIX hydrolase [Marinoscillum furvescens]|uniref:ADP-ribose pyrophosphatase YjhB (NUDIX family) n=1 Tax=Marinoscillum furvescens DSM 4134 TaxID=1122208 RepID=A0A3D9L1L2_MARFU|nr:NUDIX domain-containing protein [Marinoscillum furvescens]RED97925.1 ADP-ribose pyrophosphatase YjhB (NUDIX family) [Marinoscillum furvescens DSM 4134]